MRRKRISRIGLALLSLAVFLTLWQGVIWLVATHPLSFRRPARS